MNQWCAIQVRAGREQLSASHLDARGYKVFLPLRTVTRPGADRAKQVQSALFEGYLFAYLDDVRRSGTVVSAPGVIRIVGTREGPLSVLPEEIDSLRRLIAAAPNPTPWTYFDVADTVRITAGPFKGVAGVVVRAPNGPKLIVSISLLRRSVAVELDTRDVERDTEHASRCIGAASAPVRTEITEGRGHGLG